MRLLCCLITLLTLPALAASPQLTLVEAARNQIGVTVSYDPSYRQLSYPGGDVPIDRGVCTDVVIRALRQAWQLDLQREVHEEMRAHFTSYPQHWGLRGPDRNIDHRRVPNLQTWFKRRGYSLPLSTDASQFQSGDLVTVTVPPHLPHIMLVSDRRNGEGIPLVIHNIGGGTREEDRLFEFKLTGHYRLQPPR
ncbi:MAG: DUF1287 domain-containing protein [Gammaproteobacteria bacterium]|nr:DUF1287 domain-containing protein [Gammaproteobacteria bacterium]